MSSKSERTRRRILDTARELFNEQGTATVSTNRIAAVINMSPGNLYYHFRDKQAIIRGLFDLYAREFDNRWPRDQDAGKNLAILGRNLVSSADVSWRYRFLGRELMALLRADPDLRAAYETVYDRRMSEWVMFAELLVWQRMLRAPLPPRTLRDLVVAIWLVAEGWLPFLDLTGDPTDAVQAARGTDVVMVVLEPYLTAEGRAELGEWL
jgi:AcrR family transcriptional regulator